jgi:histone H3/H4
VPNGGLTMASERQIAANRRNARKGTGPRSGAGRKRASRNAYRHGLTLSIASTKEYAKQLETLVRKIAGDTKDAVKLERARTIAQADLELARVRRVKVALIERACVFGELDPPQLAAAGSIRLLNAAVRDRDINAINAVLRGSDIDSIEASASMPQEPERSAEAVRRVLPELRKLDRYERRAAAQRDRAVAALALKTHS